ncbi:M23 family metallopeptidase [Amnibacterium sp. CER49]|uniref:murein hydrolase activator EnvC family protein n=1 Tax=Amnibacterium sp. CER49 TaxID=3039161 RepID=UPI002449A657|nr:M23 family metallopeptidase [Amnibacterium sp. CER49]MDH2442726.1 M23 family metallopeptidase [Amnibacterium sp. CER49]
MLRVPVAGVVLAAAALLTGAAVPSQARAAPLPRWSWPVPAPHRVARPFVAPSGPYAGGHRGIDVAAPAGTTVTAPADGRVVWAGTIVDRGVVAIDHGDGVRSSFEPLTPRVHLGDTVLRGQAIGAVAAGGTHPDGVLHIGARIRGEYVSPLLLLGGLQRAVLLPSATATTGGAPAGSSR